jgi:hypothetical protein
MGWAKKKGREGCSWAGLAGRRGRRGSRPRSRPGPVRLGFDFLFLLFSFFSFSSFLFSDFCFLNNLNSKPFQFDFQ